MWPVSERFREVVAGSHRAVARVVALSTTQFVAEPVGGLELPILGGDVQYNSLQDINGTIDLEVPGDYWDELQPFGVELHAARGVDFGDGSLPEMVPLGYFRVDEVDQQDRPYGTVRVRGSDRMAQVIDSRLLVPYDYPAGTTVRALAEKLINGAPVEPVVGYGVYPGVTVPIIFAGMNGDATLPAGVVEDSIYEHLADLADAKGCTLRFDRLGRLLFDLRDRAPGEPSVHRIAPGEGGTLIQISRKVTRKGVYNLAVAWGSDPEQPTGRKVAYRDDGGPLDWRGKFGVVPVYYSSPVLRNEDAASQAAATRLSRYRGLPEETGAATVPNPALEALDPITLNDGLADVEHLVDRLTVPLVGDAPCLIDTRVLNELPDSEDSSGEGGVQNPTPLPEPEEPEEPGPPDGTSLATFIGLGVRSWGNLGVGFLPGDPLDEDGDGHTDFSQDRLTAGLILPDHFDWNPARTAARLTVPVTAGKTSDKTQFPRTEVRGMKRDGKTKENFAVGSGKGRHLHFVRNAVISMPDGDPRVCMIQYHDSADDICQIRWEAGKVIVKIGDSEIAKTISGVAAGTVHEYGLEVLDSTLRFWMDGQVIHSKGGFSGSGWYGKHGLYIQARKDRVTDLSDVGVLDVYDAIMWHEGDPMFAHTFAGVTLG